MTEDNVEVGELTVQFTADGSAATDEVDAFRREVRAKIASLEHADAVVETFSLPIDARLFRNGGGADE